MRVTAEVKAATRSKVLEVARQLFAENGFEATTTRDIARAAGIATGTLFNYFATKEAVMACLASEAMAAGLSEFERARCGSAVLEEQLFALIATGLRLLKPLRKHLPSLLDTTLSPLARGNSDEHSFRVAHLEMVAHLAVSHGHGELSPLALQLYWTLYTGILVFWANDKSRKQEDTLALIDHSLQMFVSWLADNSASQRTAEKK